jgi:hypothetical protein
MNTAINALHCVIFVSATAAAWAAPSAAEEPVPASSAVTQSSQTKAQAEAGEPRADTSVAQRPPPSSTPSTAVPLPAGPPPAVSSPAVPTAAAATPGSPAAGSPAAPANRPAAAARTPAKSTATDHIDLGVATVTGDQEQPKVMYIVPWKKSDIGDLSGKPMHSLLDEALAPVDRDEFKREVVYYQAVQADASQNGASRQPAKQGEK